MSVTLLCPRLTCRAVLCVPDHVRGKHVKCAECGVTLMVPLGRPVPAAPPKDADADTPDAK